MADGERVPTGASRHAMTFIIASPSRAMATAGNPVAVVDRAVSGLPRPR
jgi:hypothetical protein